MDRKPRAIIASDSASTCEQVARVARELGYGCVFTRTGLELLDHLKEQTGGEHSDDVIIIDLSREAWIGYYLVEVLVHELCSIKVVAITDGNRKMARPLRALGVRAVRIDPGESDELHEALARRAADRRRARPMASVRPLVSLLDLTGEEAG